MRKQRLPLRLTAGALASLLMAALLSIFHLEVAAAAGSNLALGKAASSSSYTQTYVPSNINDGNQASYWESINGAFPQWAEVDLGSSTAVNQVILKLPNGWGTRSQTLSVQGSPDNGTFSTIVASASYTFDGSANTVTINFTQTNTRYLRINITANTVQPGGQLSELEIYGPAGSGGTNLASGKTMSESSHSQTYAASNANDGNQSTYWESANDAFPQWLQVDLGSSVSINKVVLKLPTSGWGARTETLAIQGSTTGSNFSDIVASTAYSFDGSSNVVTINFNATTTRYVRLNITANTGWPAGQVSEFEVYGPTTGDTQAPTAPTSLAYTQPQSGQINLTWNASTDNVGVTGYDIYLNGSLKTSVPSRCRLAAPTPIATTDSPSAMMMTRPWRSAKYAGLTENPLSGVRYGDAISKADAPAHSPYRQGVGRNPPTRTMVALTRLNTPTPRMARAADGPPESRNKPV
jgi:F5/8 type C domain/NedA-like, galactose-binding domain